MDDKIEEIEELAEGHSDYKPANRFDAAVVHHLSWPTSKSGNSSVASLLAE